MGRTKILLGKDNHQLGDTIGWMGQVERYQRASQEEVHVFCNFSNLFGAPNLHVYSLDDPLWYESFDKKFIYLSLLPAISLLLVFEWFPAFSALYNSFFM